MMGQVTDPASARADARAILLHALECVLPEAALGRFLKLDETADTLMVAGRAYDLGRYDRILVVGGGKATLRMGAELVRILGDRITAGALNVYRQQAGEPFSDRIQLFPADHPTPNQAAIAGANRMVELLRGADRETLVIALISGGGSSLMALPVEGVSLQDYRAISELLLSAPATIDEINSVRKHIDRLKGGGMRLLARKAGGFISLVLSDVPVTKTGVVDDPSVIASGPTVGDGSTFAMAKGVLVDHGIWDRTPAAVRRYIQDNLGRSENETLPKESGLLAEARSQFVIIGNNDLAMEAAGRHAEELGYEVHLVGWRTGSTADKLKREVSVEIERIWATIAPHQIAGDQITVASLATDGVDGRSDLAGAIADGATLRVARRRGLDHREYLENYDSASFFQALGMGIQTGPSGTNVADVALALITNPDDEGRRLAFVFGGEPTVHIDLPPGRGPGRGGRNTHLVLLAAVKLDQRQGHQRIEAWRVCAPRPSST